MTANSIPISCKIRASGQTVIDLAYIVELCAGEIGLSLEIVARDQRIAEPFVTLHASAEQAASQHPLWCLVCRLACFCPQTRVGVLVYAQDKFAQPAVPRTCDHRSA